jgi:hypothetical protein
MASRLLLHNATLIDGHRAETRPGVSVLVEDTRIARIAASERAEAGMRRDRVRADAKTAHYTVVAHGFCSALK